MTEAAGTHSATNLPVEPKSRELFTSLDMASFAIFATVLLVLVLVLELLH